MKRTKYIVQAAIIAALYATLTLVFYHTSFGPVQLRFAEALTVLPAFTHAAVPGLFAGCLIANIFSGEMLDIVFGSLATLLAAFLSAKMPKRGLVPLPPVVINGIVVAVVLNLAVGAPLLFTMLTVALGQTVACYGFGYPLMLVLERYKDRIFK